LAICWDFRRRSWSISTYIGPGCEMRRSFRCQRPNARGMPKGPHSGGGVRFQSIKFGRPAPSFFRLRLFPPAHCLVV
jgi:hypothetical protein